MKKNELRWLAVALAAAPILFLACGGNDSNPVGGSAGATGTTTGATGSTGSGGAAGAGTDASAGRGGGTSTDSSVPDGRIPCGTVARGCNPNGQAPICDSANNRCVQCLMNSNCTTDPAAPLCNTMTGRCAQCLDNTQCAAQMVCSAGGDCVPSCTTNAQCVGPDGGASQNPYCNTATQSCVECLQDSHCAPPGADGGFNQPFCVANQCVQCRTDADCTAPATCNVN